VRVDQAGLARQRLAVFDHPHHVVGASPDARTVHDDKFTRVTEYLVDIGPQPPRSPPANLSVAATSDLRSQGLVTLMVASSAFTNAVMAIAE
jgi:hypothetical protein